MRHVPQYVLIKLLRRYACHSFDRVNLCATEVDNEGKTHALSAEMCCGAAADRMEEMRIENLKYIALVNGLKKHNAEYLYEYIMGQTIDKAFL